jgi:hypothetical protein
MANDYGGLQKVYQAPPVSTMAYNRSVLETPSQQAVSQTPGKMQFKPHIMEEFTATRRIGGGSEQIPTSSSALGAHNLSKLSTQLQSDDPFNRGKFKGVNKFEETTKHVIALSTDKRRILWLYIFKFKFTYDWRPFRTHAQKEDLRAHRIVQGSF